MAESSHRRGRRRAFKKHQADRGGIHLLLFIIEVKYVSENEDGPGSALLWLTHWVGTKPRMVVPGIRSDNLNGALADLNRAMQLFIFLKSIFGIIRFIPGDRLEGTHATLPVHLCDGMDFEHMVR